MLPGGFVLPVSIVTETWTQYDLTDQVLTLDLPSVSRKYLVDTMCAGRILLAQEQTQETDGLLILHGNYSCYEMIGTIRLEESLLDHGKND